MRTPILTGTLLFAVIGLSACVSNTAVGNNSLNDKAAPVRANFTSEDSLQSADFKLQSCVAGIFILQLEMGIEQPKTSTIEYACEGPETEYRAAVMARVRDEWQDDPSILYNTANTATENLYRTTLGMFK